LIDTTQLEQPDTPAPVFAARAFKGALFGTPSVNRVTSGPKQPVVEPTTDETTGTPQSKPQGILLTPGTGTTRAKRVSFRRDVETNKAKQPTDASRPARAAQNMRQPTQEKTHASDDDWEEDDDDDPHCGHDVTVDLNEPYSQSGRYWKGEFEKYHNDAKAEMEKLLKYKQLAKSYARQKDAEALELARALKTEQEKVVKMEKKIAENASNIISQHEANFDDAPPALMEKLAKQTALAVQYRRRVQELEGRLESFPAEDQEEAGAKGRRKSYASPRSQRISSETQQELRKARAQAKEMNGLRDQIANLKQELRRAEKRVAQAEVARQNEGLDTSRTKELRAQLREAKEDSQRKTEEIRQLKIDFEAFRQDRQAYEDDLKAVLDRTQAKMSALKKELRQAKSTTSEDARLERKHAQFDTEATEDPRANELNSTKAGRDPKGGTAPDLFGLKEIEVPNARSRTLREQYKDTSGESGNAVLDTTALPAMSGALAVGPKLEQPKWQPFVPRSPRNRAYLSQEVHNRISTGSARSATTKPKDILAPDLPALVESTGRPENLRKMWAADTQVDLLQDQFARLGGPSAKDRAQSSLMANSSKSALPADRRAAAMARIEQRMAEKKQRRAAGGRDKENVRP
jgi:hypothetical protein